MNSNCSNLLDPRNHQKQVKKAFCYKKLFWPCTVWIKCSSDLKIFANSRPSASNFKSFSRSIEQFFLTVGQNNFGNKIPFLFFFCTYRVILLSLKFLEEQNFVSEHQLKWHFWTRAWNLKIFLAKSIVLKQYENDNKKKIP